MYLGQESINLEFLYRADLVKLENQIIKTLKIYDFIIKLGLGPIILKNKVLKDLPIQWAKNKAIKKCLLFNRQDFHIMLVVHLAICLNI